MKKIISVYIIFAFLLMSFAGCGKLVNIVGLNQSDAPAPPKVNDQLEASSEIGAKDLTKKESWKEWICRQWNDNKRKWIGGTVVVSVIGYGIYRYSNSRVDAPPVNVRSANLFLDFDGSDSPADDEVIIMTVPPLAESLFNLEFEEDCFD